jgi:FkbH-like protein
LQLPLESFIFLDDNAVECAEVQSACPQVLTLQLPAAPGAISAFLEHIWAFDHLEITDEDRVRTKRYQQNNQRREFAKNIDDIATFLDQLNLHISITPMVASQIERVAQLLQRTNQFNTSAIRRSAGEIQHLLAKGEHECLVIDVRDRFGDYGLVGVVLFHHRKRSFSG